MAPQQPRPKINKLLIVAILVAIAAIMYGTTFFKIINYGA